MTKEEVFRLKPGDLLRIDNPGGTATHALVVGGAGPDVTLSWQQSLRGETGNLALARWILVSAETVASVLHRSRLTRVA